MLSLAFLGLDGAGKTSVLRCLEPHKSPRIDPTVGVRRTAIDRFNVWDVSGHGRDRSLWMYYAPVVDAIVYVVDARDRLRLGMSRDELWTILHGVDVSVPLLVYLNKSEDASCAMTPRDVEGCFRLQDYKGIWRIEACSALTGLGIQAGLNWITSKLINKQ